MKLRDIIYAYISYDKKSARHYCKHCHISSLYLIEKKIVKKLDKDSYKKVICIIEEVRITLYITFYYHKHAS